MKIVNAKNGEFLENGFINALVYFEGFDNFVQFTASPDDPEEHGRHLYADLKAGKYGPVAPFTVTPEMLTAAKQAKHAEINAWRDRQENDNIIFELDGHRWDGGKASQERLSPVVVAAGAGILPEGFFWTDADNHDIPVSAAFLQKLEASMVQAMVMQGFRIHERQRQMKEEVAQMTDINAITSYQPGWAEEA
ncbi:DUF4376 domain-containing protein [Salmonella enterica]|nr:DUF4376 domain-containing protein [Salmonella enterica]